MAASRRGDDYILDRFLLPRIEQYGRNNSIGDIDSTVGYLRACYPEYQRKQLGPFKKVVLRAVRIVRQRMQDEEEGPSVVGPGTEASRRSGKVKDSAEARLESREREHLRKRGFSSDTAEESDSSDEEVILEKPNQSRKNQSKVEDSSDTTESELDKNVVPAFNLLNSSLMSTYNGRPALIVNEADAPKPAEDRHQSDRAASARKSPKTPKNARKRERESEPRINVKKNRTQKKENEEKQTRSDLGFKDFGGLGSALDEILDFLLPFKHGRAFEVGGVEAMRGLLLHGPPGCGKTTLAEAIANEADVFLLRVSAPEIVSATAGESEEKLRRHFEEAARFAPALIFIDEIDAISSKRESAQREMERRIVAQLMLCMDELGQAMKQDADDERPSCVLVIGATNRPEALDSALRRRFEREVCLTIPDETARAQILTVLTRKLRLQGDFDFNGLARRTPGFVGADLKALTKEAGLAAIKRAMKSRDRAASDESWWKETLTPNELENLKVTMQDFEEGMKRVQPSMKREGFTEVPNVTFEDVGALDSVRQTLELFICKRFEHAEDYEALQFRDCGFLLYGPPGCGKTLIAKATANSAGVNFIYIKAGELFNKYVGESERAVRRLFARARSCAPCVIFFDEVDALAPNRGNEANAATDRVVNQLLVEMDGLELRKGIFLLAATNRPGMIDPALLRPGRLGKRIYVPMPDAQGRTSILRALLRRMPLTADVDITKIAEHELCKDFSGADLQGLVQEASAVALAHRFSASKEELAKPVALSQQHFLEALNTLKPSVSSESYGKEFNSQQQDKKRAYRIVACPTKG